MATPGERLILFFTQLTNDPGEWDLFRTEEACRIIQDSTILEEPEKTWMLTGDVVAVGEAIDAVDQPAVTILFRVAVPSTCSPARGSAKAGTGSRDR